MAQLIEPDGTYNVITTVQNAIEFCRMNSGWTWEYCDD